MIDQPDYKALAKRLSNALLEIRPLGGSEMFIGFGDDYFADPEYCKKLIVKMRTDLFEARKELAIQKVTRGAS